MTRKPHFFTILILAGGLLGFLFAMKSTSDFAQHLDRQMHSVSCSFVPIGEGGKLGEASGCKTTMFSEYSSVLRDSVWGGVPISLPAMSVFAFLLLFAFELCMTRRQTDPRATGFMALATLLPALTSVAMAVISLSTLGAACKLCIGIYISSAICLGGALGLWRRAVNWTREGRAPAEPDPALAQTVVAHGEDPAWAGGPVGAADEPQVAERPSKPRGTVAARPKPVVGWSYLLAAFAVGVVMVVVPFVAYAQLAPDHSDFIGTCGSLEVGEDRHGIVVPLGGGGSVPAVEILDPMCPACKTFEDRLHSAGFADDLDRKAILFPLDAECNWMVDDRDDHDGACAVSEAMLCAPQRAPEILAWTFSEQESIKKTADLTDSKKGAKAVRQLITQRFPDLQGCVGSAKIAAKLERSLWWIADKELAITTPQLYIDGVRLCGEDSDLGLEYQMSRMLDRHRAGTLRAGGVK